MIQTTFTNTKFGLPLNAASVTQTIIPVIIKPTGRLHGFFTIASTTFTQATTDFVLSDGTIPLTTVTPPNRISNGSIDPNRTLQYFAYVVDISQESKRPWQGHTSWISNDNSGNDTRHYMAERSWLTRYLPGVLVGSLVKGMSTYPTISSAPGPAPVVSNATIQWAAQMNITNPQVQNEFFDFNWIDMFNATLVASGLENTVNPISIAIVSNPVSGLFKSTLVQNSSQTILPGGGVTFNTVRIIKLGAVTAGPQIFQFRVTDSKNLSSNVQLTLSVV